MTGRSGLAALVRQQSLRGKNYARLARPALMGNVSLGAPVAVAAVAAALLASVLLMLPISTSFVGGGLVGANASPIGVIRAPRDGQLVRIASEGDRVSAGHSVAFIEVRSRSESGDDPAVSNRTELRRIRAATDQELSQIAERHRLLLLQLQAERQLVTQRLATIATDLEAAEQLTAQAQALSDRVDSDAGLTVSRMDALAIKERVISARARVADLRHESVRLRSALVESTRREQIVAIETSRDTTQIQRKHAQDEASAIARAGAYGSDVLSREDGFVVSASKRAGEWVKAGDELLRTGQSVVGDSARFVEVPLPDDMGALVKAGQQAWVWPNAMKRAESGIRARVVAVERAGYFTQQWQVEKTGMGPPHAAGFVARVEVQGLDLESKLAGNVVLGARVDVEIVVESRRLYQALMPARLRGASAVNR